MLAVRDGDFEERVQAERRVVDRREVEQHAPAGPDHPARFGKRFGRIADVLERVDRSGGVEGVVVERQAARVAVHAANARRRGAGEQRVHQIQTGDVVAMQRDAPGDAARAAADLEDAFRAGVKPRDDRGGARAVRHFEEGRLGPARLRLGLPDRVLLLERREHLDGQPVATHL